MDTSLCRARKYWPASQGKDLGCRNCCLVAAVSCMVLLATLLVPPALRAMQLSPEKLSERPMRPSTAMESVVMSHTLQREYMQQRNPFYIPSSHTYGSRLSLEQVSQCLEQENRQAPKLPGRLRQSVTRGRGRWDAWQGMELSAPTALTLCLPLLYPCFLLAVWREPARHQGHAQQVDVALTL